MPEYEPKGSEAEGCVWTSPWAPEKLLLVLPAALEDGGAESDCHHDCADVAWSSGFSTASVNKERKYN